MQVKDLGLTEYSKALEIQEEAVRQAIEARSQSNVSTDTASDFNTHEVLLVCEHPKVITVGRAIGSGDEVLTDQIPVVEVSRGGRATLHLPGQIVVYPILDLNKRGRDLHGHMRLLEDAIINTLSDFRIESTRIEGKTGVWVLNSRRNNREGKIASIGVAAKEWVSYHGLALNVCCDLEEFKALQPCGFSGDVMTSVAEEMSDGYKSVWAMTPEKMLKQVRLRIVENLLEVFGANGVTEREKSTFGESRD